MEKDESEHGDADVAYTEFYSEAVIIVERELNLESLSHSFIPEVFRDRTWTPLLTGFGNVCNPIVRDFFSNEITLIVGLEEHSLPFLPHPFRTYFKSIRLLLNLLYHMMIEEPGL